MASWGLLSLLLLLAAGSTLPTSLASPDQAADHDVKSFKAFDFRQILKLARQGNLLYGHHRRLNTLNCTQGNYDSGLESLGILLSKLETQVRLFRRVVYAVDKCRYGLKKSFARIRKVTAFLARKSYGKAWRRMRAVLVPIQACNATLPTNVSPTVESRLQAALETYRECYQTVSFIRTCYYQLEAAKIPPPSPLPPPSVNALPPSSGDLQPPPIGNLLPPQKFPSPSPPPKPLSPPPVVGNDSASSNASVSPPPKMSSPPPAEEYPPPSKVPFPPPAFNNDSASSNASVSPPPQMSSPPPPKEYPPPPTEEYPPPSLEQDLPPPTVEYPPPPTEQSPPMEDYPPPSPEVIPPPDAFAPLPSAPPPMSGM